MGETKHYTRNGLFALAALFTAWFGYQFIAEKGLFDRAIRLYIFTENAREIQKNSPVIISGLKVGKVRNLSLSGTRILIELGIDKDIRIPKPAQFYATTCDFFNLCIEIEPLDDANDHYHNKDTVSSLLEVSNFEIKFDSILQIK